MIDVEFNEEYLYLLGNDNSRSSAINGGAIAGGIIGAILTVVIVVVIIMFVYCLITKRRSGSNAYKTTKYSRPNPDLQSTSSRQNLYPVLQSSESPASTQYRGQQNHAYTGYQPPAPLYTGDSSPASSNQTRRPPPRPPTSQAPSQGEQLHSHHLSEELLLYLLQPLLQPNHQPQFVQ